MRYHCKIPNILQFDRRMQDGALKAALKSVAVGIVVIALLLTLIACVFSYGYGQALRRVGILTAKNVLIQATNDYAEVGYVIMTNRARSSWVWLSSNVVAISRTQYQCFVTAHVAKFYDEGNLAMTTNGIFIWLDAKHPPKIIGPDYRPPFFPPRF